MAKLTEQSRVQCAMYEHQFCQYCVKFLVLVGPQMHDKTTMDQRMATLISVFK